MSDGNAPGTRAAGAGGRIEDKAYLPKASGLTRLNFEEVAGRRFDPCRRREVDGGVGPDLLAGRGNEGYSVRISTSVWEYELGRARATSSHRVCVGTTFTESWDWRSEALPWVRMSRFVQERTVTKGPGERRREVKAPEWTFHEEPSGLVKGHDAGLYTFEHAGEGGWIRELLQNSLDARGNSDAPVEIEINAQQVASEIIDAKGLRETVICCQQHPERLGKVSSLFDQAVDALDQSEITAICYSESNTTGAKTSDGTWLALTRSEGISGNKNAAAMGSYGIGKNAGVAASPLHAVVYSTRYYEEKEGIVKRAVGRAILVSHEGEDGHLRQPFGWLGTSNDSDHRGSDLIGDHIPECRFW